MFLLISVLLTQTLTSKFIRTEREFIIIPMKGSTVLSENILTGLSIVISFILMVLVVRLVLSQQSERTYRNLFESIARDIALIIDRQASTAGSEKTEYEIPKGVHIEEIRIDYKSVFLTYEDGTIRKFFSGMLNSGPYTFNDPTVFCFVKKEQVIQISPIDCDYVDMGLPPTPPEVISVSPNSVSIGPGNTITFTATYRDLNGVNDFTRVYFAVSPPELSIDPSGDKEDANCQAFEEQLMRYVGVVYRQPLGVSGEFYIAAEKDDGLCPWDNDKSKGDMNEPGTMRVESVSHTVNGNDLIVEYEVTFHNDFPVGNYNIYMMAVDNAGLGSCGDGTACWKKMGEFRVS